MLTLQQPFITTGRPNPEITTLTTSLLPLLWLADTAVTHVPQCLTHSCCWWKNIIGTNRTYKEEWCYFWCAVLRRDFLRSLGRIDCFRNLFGCFIQGLTPRKPAWKNFGQSCGAGGCSFFKCSVQKEIILIVMKCIRTYNVDSERQCCF